MALARALQDKAAAARAEEAQQQAAAAAAAAAGPLDRKKKALRKGSKVAITDMDGNIAATGVVKLLEETDILMPLHDPHAKVCMTGMPVVLLARCAIQCLCWV
jgi:hypothetical protein